MSQKDFPTIVEDLGKGARLEIITLSQGTVWAFVKAGEAIMFPCLLDFMRYDDGEKISRKYCDEEDIDDLLEKATSWYDINLITVE